MSSVRVGQRHDSKILFLDTARELVEHTIMYCRKFPKSAMFLITKDINDLGKEIYKNVCCANAIYPKSTLDIEMRARFLKTALGLIDTMDCFLGIANDTIGNLRDKNGKPLVSDFGWIHWGELLTKEAGLIKKVLQSDEKFTF